MNNFKKITNFDGRKKSSVVAEKILVAIQKGRFKPGQRLPSERTIAGEMGVSQHDFISMPHAIQQGQQLWAKNWRNSDEHIVLQFLFLIFELPFGFTYKLYEMLT